MCFFSSRRRHTGCASVTGGQTCALPIYPLALSNVTVEFLIHEAENAVEVQANCKLKGRTGVEMEALTAASIAALTIYDMCKAVDRGMVITDTLLISEERRAGQESGSPGRSTSAPVPYKKKKKSHE